MHPAEQNAPTAPMKIHTVQAIRKIAFFIIAAIGIAVVAVTASAAPSGAAVHELIEWIGIVLIVICILGRTWSSLYIGGRKIDEFVQTGPYSIMRNPLYFFSCVGAVGVGMQFRHRAARADLRPAGLRYLPSGDREGRAAACRALWRFLCRLPSSCAALLSEPPTLRHDE